MMFFETLFNKRAESACRSIFAILFIAIIYECKIDNFFSSYKGTGAFYFLISWYDWNNMSWAYLYDPYYCFYEAIVTAMLAVFL